MNNVIIRKKCRRWIVAVEAGLVSMAGFAALSSDGTYAVLTDCNHSFSRSFAKANET